MEEKKEKNTITKVLILLWPNLNCADESV